MKTLSPHRFSLPATKGMKKPKAISFVLSLSCDYSRKISKKKSRTVSQTENPDINSPLLTAIFTSQNLQSEFPTELTLFPQSGVAAIPRTTTTSRERHAVSQEPASCNACNLERMKSYTAEDLEEERRKGVSTNLSLSYGYNTVNILDNNLDLWKIKKKLKKSDLGNLSRLLISTDLVQKHILPLLSSDLLDGVVSSCGIPVIFWDVDTETKHKLIFKKWVTSRSYVFVGGWTSQFVQRRNLKEGDEIGIYWDVPSSSVNFCVIDRA